MIFEVAHHIGLLPLLWLVALRWRGRTIGVEWFWLAGAFAASWLADTAAHWMGPFLVSPVYLVSQASIVGFVFLSRRDAITLVGVLVAVGIGAVLWKGVEGPDVLLHTAAWLPIVWIVWPLKQLGWLRTSLLVAFGVGWVCWMGYAIWPGWGSWLFYQSARLNSILLFCWAATSPLPRLKLTRA